MRKGGKEKGKKKRINQCEKRGVKYRSWQRMEEGKRRKRKESKEEGKIGPKRKR